MAPEFLMGWCHPSSLVSDVHGDLVVQSFFAFLGDWEEALSRGTINSFRDLIKAILIMISTCIWLHSLSYEENLPAAFIDTPTYTPTGRISLHKYIHICDACPFKELIFEALQWHIAGLPRARIFISVPAMREVT